MKVTMCSLLLKKNIAQQTNASHRQTNGTRRVLSTAGVVLAALQQTHLTTTLQ